MYGNTMVAEFGWWQLLAAWAIIGAIALVAFGASQFTSLFDVSQAGLSSNRLTSPRHDPAAHAPPSNVLDPFYDETETSGRNSSQH